MWGLQLCYLIFLSPIIIKLGACGPHVPGSRNPGGVQVGMVVKCYFKRQIMRYRIFPRLCNTKHCKNRSKNSKIFDSALTALNYVRGESTGEVSCSTKSPHNNYILGSRLFPLRHLDSTYVSSVVCILTGKEPGYLCDRNPM